MINLRQVQLGHRRFLSQFDAAVLRELNDARAFGIAHVQAHPEFKPRSGELQRATTGEVIRTARGAIVKFKNRRKYAKAIDSGARPHIIRARNGKTLRFMGRSGLVFRKSVNHPGNKPYRFLQKATVAAGGMFAKSLRSRLARIKF